MITWEQFESVVRIYPKIANYDQSYELLMGDNEFIERLKKKPGLKELHKIIEFLNKWGCMIKCGNESAKMLLSVITDNLQLLDFLRKYSIEDVDFDGKIFGDNFCLRVKDLIILLYSKFRHVDFKFGATATAKILHILVPNLLVMWDKDILDNYQRRNIGVSDSPPDYINFLISIKDLSDEISKEFYSAEIHLSGKGKDHGSYLSMIIHCNPPKTLAKFLDEYNWVTITRNVWNSA